MKLIALTSLICLILIDEGPAKKTQDAGHLVWKVRGEGSGARGSVGFLPQGAATTVGLVVVYDHAPTVKLEVAAGHQHVPDLLPRPLNP
jgi:hypothetical protein